MQCKAILLKINVEVNMSREPPDFIIQGQSWSERREGDKSRKFHKKPTSLCFKLN